MIPPGAKQIIQVIVTNYCDLRRCSNCTQQITHQREPFHMTVDNFRRACESLADWSGIVGVFGGNPVLHPRFADLCAVLVDTIRDKRRRGLWTNHLHGRGEVCRETFGYFNLNAHADQAAAAEMARELPGFPVYGATRRSWHSPVLTAIRDYVGRAGGPADEAEMWAWIERCDINQKWSGAITQRRGELRAYFCEVAAAFDNSYDEDCGLPVSPGWWRLGMEAFEAQSRRWCPSCGVPMRLLGHLDLDFADDLSQTHRGLVGTRRLASIHHVAPTAHCAEATDYQRLREPSGAGGRGDAGTGR